jgi:UDP-N-acetylmuramoyl-tripeptide--D-alanyl-D-alanine ligase
MFELGDPGAAGSHQSEVHQVAGDIILIDDTTTQQANDLVGTLKRVTMAAASQRRVVVVTGAPDLSGDSDYDSLDAFAAVFIRLNVSQVFAVGPDARAIFLSVGREGSWDGESQHCSDVDQAYDEVRAFIRPGDVVLVMGGTGQSLLPIVSRLVEDLQ